MGEIAFRPVEVGLRQIERGGLCAAECGEDGKYAGVGESVEDRLTGLCALAHALPVIALVEEDALRVAAVE